MNIKQMLHDEIKASKKDVKPFHLSLSRTDSGDYVTINKLKIQGDFLLSSKGIDEQIVRVDRVDDKLVVSGLECEDEQISAFLSKDETALLSAVGESLKTEEFMCEPSFIIGPPGTGKTKVITEIIEHAIAAGEKVLVVSQTNMAVENVFEKIDFKRLAFKDGDVTLAIKTELSYLKKYNTKAVNLRKIKPLQDEVEILEDTLKNILKERREQEPFLHELCNKDSSIETRKSNTRREKQELDISFRNKKEYADSLNRRIKGLQKNSFLKSISNLISSSKLVELIKNRDLLKEECNELETDIDNVNKKLKEIQESKEINEKELINKRARIQNINDNKILIEKRIDFIKKEIFVLNSEDVFKNAKLVGATIVGASLNKKIQNAEFDKIIIDEGSMALTPYLVATSQALNNSSIKCKSYDFKNQLTTAQNEAVAQSLKNKLVIVGDPRQLSGIAKTYDMKKSVFDIYQIDKIFLGEKVKKTVFLDINFRNHPDIVELTSRLFYGNMLKSGKSHNGKNSLYIKNSQSAMTRSDGSYVNHGNAVLIIDQVTQALKKGRRSIAVISPYRKQAELIEESFKSLRVEYPDADMQTGTVHKFQGKEKDIVIFDITFAPSGVNALLPATYQGDSESEASKLLNVAMTRAEQFFILVGDIKGISEMNLENSILSKWVKSIKTLSYMGNIKKKAIANKTK